jgi:hypothetical protein
VVESRAAERLAGARGPYITFFSGKKSPPVDNFLGKKFFRTSTLQLLSRDFILFFHAIFRYLAPKNRYLVLCAEIFNTQKRLGPNKKFSGAPSTSGPGAIPPPSRRPCVYNIVYLGQNFCFISLQIVLLFMSNI